MALGDIHCTFGISKTQRSSKTAGFLFFLLLEMSLLSRVRPENTTDSGSSTSPVSESASTNTMGVSSSTMTSISASVSSVTAASFSSSSNATVSSVTITSTGNATSSTGNSSMISCPAFTCTSDCYGQYMNTTWKPCSTNASFCEIIRQDTSYSVGCSDACVYSCGNTTLSNCTVSCCTTTNCLYNTIYNISNPFSTAATTKSTTTTATTKATVATTQATNGKKCHAINCAGATCYKTITTQSSCAVGSDYCMLKKTTSGTTENWEAGCSGDCRKMTTCSTTTTTSPCYLECCNATTSSCLKLTGEVNMPSSATRGPQSPALITASILLLWILRAFT